jgi:3-oxoacyl-ACP reductase-like protein
LTGVRLDVPNLIETPRHPGTMIRKKLLPFGVGKGSTGIGIGIFKVFLSGDAHVVITPSCCIQATAEYDQGIFQGFRSRGSALTVVLFIKARLQPGC